MDRKITVQPEVSTTQQLPKLIFPHYQSYLLRLWQETPKTPWRVSLQPTGSDKRIGFSDLEDLVGFIEAQINQSEYLDKK